MLYSEVRPAPSLRSLVACYWAITRPAPEHRVLPDGCIDILVAGEEHAMVVGTMTRAVVAPGVARGAIGIRFRPGEAARVIPEAARELTDHDASLADVWRSDAREMNEELDAAIRGSLARAAPRLDAILARRLARHGGAVDAKVRAAVEMLDRGASVRAVAGAVGLSERQLSRRFEARVGVAPKTFARVMRLQRAASAIASGASASCAAALAGYADQAHFNRDARDLAGVTPGALVRELGTRVLGMSDSFKTGTP